MLSRFRAAPESVKQRLRRVLVWLVRAVLAVPNSRRVAHLVMHLMPKTSSWLLRRYKIYWQMSLDTNAHCNRLIVAEADDLSPEEALHLRRIEAALRSSKER